MTVDNAVDSLSDSKIYEITILLWPYICAVLEGYIRMHYQSTRSQSS